MQYQTPLEIALTKNHVEGVITLLTFGARITDNVLCDHLRISSSHTNNNRRYYAGVMNRHTRY